ncbi:MAG TPA: HEAT repeat domain-containing protein [Allosphingosinicella sp.]|nr:HEAT repeat domain-containing protein [Allosphingosinicella sp.]
MEEALLASRGDLEALGRVVSQFMRSGTASAVLRGALSKCLEDYGDNVVGSLGGDSFVLARNEYLTFYMKLLPPSEDLLHTAGTDRVTVFWPVGAVTIDSYAIDGAFDPEVFDPAARLVLLESRIADETALIQRRGEARVYGFRSERPAMSVTVNLEPASSQVWMFDRKSLAAAFPTLSQNEYSSFIIFAKMAAAIGAPGAIPILTDLCSHASHAVRWAAVQSLARLNGDVARQRLRLLADDPHPEVREGAKRVLARIDA